MQDRSRRLSRSAQLLCLPAVRRKQQCKTLHSLHQHAGTEATHAYRKGFRKPTPTAKRRLTCMCVCCGSPAAAGAAHETTARRGDARSGLVQGGCHLILGDRRRQPGPARRRFRSTVERKLSIFGGEKELVGLVVCWTAGPLWATSRNLLRVGLWTI